MYERLLLLREALSEAGVIVLHADWRKAHLLRSLLDEVLGSAGFRNEIYWYFYNKMHDDRKDLLPRATNTLMVYAKGDEVVFHNIDVPREKVSRQLRRVKVDGVLVNLKDEEGNLQYQDSDAKTLDNVWPIPLVPPADVKQRADYRTQKPEALLELLIRLYTNPGDVVLDCFVGSGTTLVAAQRLGRRWIGCDINKGGIQTTAKRLQRLIREQTNGTHGARPKNKQGTLALDLAADGSQGPITPIASAFTLWRVNDYDLQLQHNEAVNLAVEHLGIERSRADGFFDGKRGRALVKIVPLNHPCSPLDLEEIKRELEARPDEDRDVTVVCLGIELAARGWIDEWNRLRTGKGVGNRIAVIELRTDPTYGKFFEHKPARADVTVTRRGDKLVVEIKDFISPTIIERLQQHAGLLQPKIDDWRAMVDSVAIDTAYDGKVFHLGVLDIPDRKTDLVAGRYEIPEPRKKCQVAVRITDMLGEEALTVAHVE